MNSGTEGSMAPGRGGQLLPNFWSIMTPLYLLWKEGHNLDVVYLDFAKAYDKVDHSVLLQKILELEAHWEVGSGHSS